MSQKEAITRYNLIIKKLRKSPATFKEIADYLARESGYQEYNFNVSIRTFQRDVKDILTVYNIDIVYDKSLSAYRIDSEDQNDASNRILEAFDIFNALDLTDRLSDHIHFEKRRPQGTENLHGLLHAIKNRFQIRFTYLKYWDDEKTQRLVEPYALKEFRNRWYLLANDLKDSRVKSFALDRLTELDITRRTFQHPVNFSVNEHFKYSFGIISPNGLDPEEIILSFDPIEGKYIKSLPLHESQVILKDNDDELLIQLYLVPTHDFLMEILSHGPGVKVLKPDSLVKEIKEVLSVAFSQYK
jgi:hypothetical protein